MTTGAWKCPDCGHENAVSSRECGMCGKRLRPILKLLGDDGVVVECSISMNANQSWARAWARDEARYWDGSMQFRVELRDDRWFLIPNPAARNETILGDEVPTEPRELIEGVVISIGRLATGVRKCRLTVQFG